ncbi:MAG: hypothetical protein OEU54_05505 [Gemmatimonadota bacterium]|nr:hypothetical protein [Gemmatimonadota bacterium]
MIRTRFSDHGPVIRLLPVALISLAGAIAAPHAVQGQTDGDYLYNVTMLRAAPGHFADLVEALEADADLRERAGDGAPFWIRHSQGDQWDFMLIYPMGDPTTFFDTERTRGRRVVGDSDAGRDVAERIERFTAFHEEWFARSIPVEDLAGRFGGMGLFHVEIFAGLPGKRAELLEQRRMENRYYAHLDRQLNVIFTREAGPNWDAMTIGFYEDLQAFAAAGVRYSEAEQNEAASAAGFESVGQIGPYLRSLLSYHNDTLGVRP